MIFLPLRELSRSEVTEFFYFIYQTVQVDKANMDDVVMDKNAPQNLVVIKDLKGDVVSVRGVKKDDVEPLYIVKSANSDISNGVVLIELK